MYRNWVNNISGVFKEYNIFNFFKKYYGYSIKKDFVINLIAFSTVGAYCCHLNDKIVCCYPVFEEMKKDKLYDSEGNEKSILTPLIHEFSHGFINPITERYNILNEKTNLFDDIRDCMKKQAYCYDSSIINEHIIRAVGARYIYLIYRDEIWYKKRIQKEKEAGFKYIDSVIDSLIYYEKHRKIYEKFDDFYPLIIENIKKYQHKE